MRQARRVLGLRCAIALQVLLLSLAAPASENSGDASGFQNPKTQSAALRLARTAITHFLKTGKTPSTPRDLPAALSRRAAVFITIEKRGRIAPRGCRGTLQPAYKNLATEIIRNAIAAATRDEKESPLRREELSKCLISITVIKRIAPIQSIAQHDAENNGLIAQSDSHIGVVLPYEGRDASTQLKWAKRKAGLNDGADVQLSELYAMRFREG